MTFLMFLEEMHLIWPACAKMCSTGFILFFGSDMQEEIIGATLIYDKGLRYQGNTPLEFNELIPLKYP